MTDAPIPIPSRPGTHRLPCPNCQKGKRDDALAVTVETDGGATWFCHRCGDRGGIRGHDDREIRPRGKGRTEARDPAKEDEERRKVEAALAVWDASEPINGTPAEAYLRGRGIDPSYLPTQAGTTWPETLAWCADADGRGNGALVVAVNHGTIGLVRGVQRIFVNADGTPQRDAKGHKIKRSRGQLGGNSARLSCPIHAEGYWGLAEGVETALAARQITGIPTWAAISAHNMPKVGPPHWARKIAIFADNDASRTGITEAGKALREFRALSHVKTVRVFMAETVGADIADFVRGDGAHVQ